MRRTNTRLRQLDTAEWDLGVDWRRAATAGIDLGTDDKSATAGSMEGARTVGGHHGDVQVMQDFVFFEFGVDN
jgi:hypothetical protein